MSNYSAKAELKIASENHYDACSANYEHDRTIYAGQEYAELTAYPSYLSNAEVQKFMVHQQCIYAVSS